VAPGQLRVDTDDLRLRAEGLRVIATEFQVAEDLVDALQGAVGIHRDTEWLRDAIGTFASTWRVRRERLRENVVDLEGFVRQVADSLEAADGDLAARLPRGQLAAAPRVPDSGGGPRD